MLQMQGALSGGPSVALLILASGNRVLPEPSRAGRGVREIESSASPPKPGNAPSEKDKEALDPRKGRRPARPVRRRRLDRGASPRRGKPDAPMSSVHRPPRGQGHVHLDRETSRPKSATLRRMFTRAHEKEVAPRSTLPLSEGRHALEAHVAPCASLVDDA
jgi:hypothetical protein